MRAKFVDTNIFIEVFVRDSGSKSNLSNTLLSDSTGLMTTDIVISEIEWVMRSGYKEDRKTISVCLRKILSSDIYIDNKKVLINTLNFYENHKVDWTDCLNMFLIKDQGITDVYSYDKGLKIYDWITRLEP